MVDQAWSPDDNFIAFNISSRSGSVEMFILNVAETLASPATQPVWFNVGEIFSSTDSLSWQPVITEETLAERPSQPYEGLVAFTSAVENGNLDIYSMRPDGSGLTNLTNDPAHDVDPYWSPDGKRIAFLSDRAGPMQVFVMNADGSDVFQVTQREAEHAFQGLLRSDFESLVTGWNDAGIHRENPRRRTTHLHHASQRTERSPAHQPAGRVQFHFLVA